MTNQVSEVRQHTAAPHCYYGEMISCDGLWGEDAVVVQAPTKSPRQTKCYTRLSLTDYIENSEGLSVEQADWELHVRADVLHHGWPLSGEPSLQFLDD